VYTKAQTRGKSFQCLCSLGNLYGVQHSPARFGNVRLSWNSLTPTPMNTPNEKPQEIPEAEKTLRIRTLNDTFRTTFMGGRILLTQGIQALGTEQAQDIITKVQSFNAFTPDNDPHGEHDFGAIEHDGKKVFWKIDCYDENLEFGSPDPSDPAQTTRVLTVMLAEEY